MNELSKRKFKLWVIVFGMMANFGLAFHQYILFMRAYFSSDKAILFLINVKGEANTEFVLMSVCMILGTIAMYYTLKTVRDWAATA